MGVDFTIGPVHLNCANDGYVLFKENGSELLNYRDGQPISIRTLTLQHFPDVSFDFWDHNTLSGTPAKRVGPTHKAETVKETFIAILKTLDMYDKDLPLFMYASTPQGWKGSYNFQTANRNLIWPEEIEEGLKQSTLPEEFLLIESFCQYYFRPLRRVIFECQIIDEIETEVW